jgi:Peptidase family M28
MIDLRLYRIAFLPAVLALVALLFSLQSQPAPLHPLVAAAGFDGSTAARLARQLAAAAPSRAPGSNGDATAAAIVGRTFRRVTAGQVLVQRFGNGGRLRNVILKLSGQSNRQIVLIAPRDTGSPPGAASSAAATGALEALASNIATSQHSKTLILVSTDGSSEGALGAKALADDFLDPAMVEAIVALEQPGAASTHEPFVLTSSTGANSTSTQLVRTAEATLADQAGLRAREPGPFGQLAALALPGGLGEQAVLIARGYAAVGLSAAGERPLPPAADRLQGLSPATLGKFGLTAFALVLALDSVPGSPVHGPDAYVSVAGNLIPGWALSAMALALILPALVAAVDALARAGRRGAAGVALRWAAARPVPLLLALGLLYAMAVVGIVPRPAFPFDPGSYDLDLTEALAIAALVLAAAIAWSRGGRNRMPVRLVPEAGGAALGLYAVLALLVIWLTNPYLALILVPLAHPWVVQARVGRRPSRARCAAVVAIALLPLVLGAASVAGRLDLGAGIPWQVVVAIGDFGISVPIALAGCALAGSLAALIVLAGAGPEAGPPGSARPPGPATRPRRAPPEPRVELPRPAPGAVARITTGSRARR